MEGAGSENVPKLGVCFMCSRNSKEPSVADVELRGAIEKEDS